MSFLFARSKPKTPQEVVFTLNELVSRSDIKGDPKILEEIHRLLAQARTIAHGEFETPADPDQMSALSKEIYATNLLLPLTENMTLFSFDGRRDVTMIYTFLLQRQIGHRSPTAEYLLKYPLLIDMLFQLAGNAETHRNANQILCEMAKQESIVAYVLSSSVFWELFRYCVAEQRFEVASDCFTTLTRFLAPDQRPMTQFLNTSGLKFIHQINQLIICRNYVIRRQAIRLQASIISHRKNKDFISIYVSDLENLKVVMRLLTDKSRTIHYEAFHLFKVFVANPQKPQNIYEVLLRNKDKLLQVMEELMQLERKERKDDEVFKLERAYVHQRIAELGMRH